MNLHKGAVTYDGSRDGHPEVSQGVADAASLAKNAVSVLNDATNPFVNGHPWDALMQALFGSEHASSTQDIICKMIFDNSSQSLKSDVSDKLHSNVQQYCQ